VLVDEETVEAAPCGLDSVAGARIEPVRAEHRTLELEVPLRRLADAGVGPRHKELRSTHPCLFALLRDNKF
jgi:hypothetical protein